MSEPYVSARKLALIVAVSLALSVTFFSPRLWLMREFVEGSFQWARAHTFLLQCEQPLRRDIEAAMHWRLLPPLVCHLLHVPAKTPLILPWLGVIVATTYVAVLFRRRLNDWRFVAGGTLLFATTSSVLVPVGWLGMNDAWVWLGLLVVALGRTRWSLAVACLLCPWIDERFIIGFPLAWLLRRYERNEPTRSGALLEAAWLLPYAALRLWLARHDSTANAATEQFLASHLKQTSILVPLAPLGWWMGLRAAWFAVAFAAWAAPHGRRFLGAIVLVGTMAVSLTLAADISRSIAIIVPVAIYGCFELADRFPLVAPRAVLALGAANLVIPAAHLTYLHIDPINPLPVELFRFIRS
jgi:hypothetical protein